MTRLPAHPPASARKAASSRIDHAEVAIDLIDPHAQNYNQHDDEQIAALAESIHRFGGQVRSVVIWARPGGRYTMIAGHGFLEAAKREGLRSVRADVLPQSFSPEDAIAYLAADNLHAQHSHPDEMRLADLLQEQLNAGYSLSALGTSAEELDELKQRLADRLLAAEEEWDAHGGSGEEDEDDLPDDDLGLGPDDLDPADRLTPGRGEHGVAEEDEGEDGAALERARLQIYEPVHTVQKGEVWRLGHHVLVAVRVFEAWQEWQPWLVWQVQEATRHDAEVDGGPRRVVFAPFPGPWLALSRRAKAMRFVLVTPDVYVCGHILDRHAEVHGEESIERLREGRKASAV